MAAAPSEVYTEFSSGATSHTGNGTKESPYNLFVDALGAITDVGTIYIDEGRAFVNDEGDGMPLQITKNVTITTSDSISRSVLQARPAGIVLGANVEFKDIVLSMENANHVLIAANGYMLTLDNVSYDSSSNSVHLFGGTLYASDSIPALGPIVGEYSKINIIGNSTKRKM